MRSPALFVSHGSPMIAIEDDPWGRALGGFAARLPRPRAAVVVSGHFEEREPVRVTASAAPETIHDFYGFPDALYRIRYPAPGDPALARRVAALLGGAGFAAELDPSRGLDHGAWVPLRFLYPDATVPVVQVSQPAPRSPETMLALGAALAPLRDDGVALVGTGGVVHNLRRIDPTDRQISTTVAADREGYDLEPWALLAALALGLAEVALARAWSRDVD